MRQVRLGSAVVAAVATGMSALVAGQYQTTFAGILDSSAVRALATNPAIRILFGPPLALDDPGGFTVWRTGTPVLVLVSVWSLLAATRITRGEEDAGRSDLLLAGCVPRRDLITGALIAVAVAVVVVAASVAVALITAGTQSTGALIHAGSVLGVGLTFGAMGTLAAQVMATRAAASGLAAAVLGAGLLARMLADGVPESGWMAWSTPFGLAGLAAPYASNQIAPLIVLAAFSAALTVATVVVAGRRDIGSGMINGSGSRRARTRLLRSVAGFAVRRAAGPATAWAGGIAACFLLVGALVTSILTFLTDNPRFAEFAAGAGFGQLDTVHGFAAAIFGLLGIPAGLYAVTRVAGMVVDENSGRLTSLLAQPVSRGRIVGTEIVVTVAGVLGLLTAAGAALWIGATITGAPLRVAAALAGAWNVAPVALLSLGAAVLALGWAPRAVGTIGALPVVGGFLLRTVDSPDWLTALSPFDHVARVPASPPDWDASAGLTAIAAALAAAGVLGYARRDLNG